MKLKPGEIKCDECNGIGIFGYEIEINKFEMQGQIIRVPGQKTEKICPKCKGTGKLDWVEAVVGKRGIRMKPGVYTREVDLSPMISEESDIEWKII